MAVSWRVFIALGLPFLFIPINTLCYAGIPQEKYNEVSGLTALMRNLGGSVGISFVTTLLARFTPEAPGHARPPHRQRQPGRLKRCAPASPAPGCSAGRLMPDAMQHAGAQIYGMAQIQARLLAYVDVIWIMVARHRDPDPAPIPHEAPPKMKPARAPMGH